MTTRFFRSMAIGRSLSAALLCVHCRPNLDLDRDIAGEVKEGVQPVAPCAGGTLAVQNAYWKCDGGFWSQVEDDTWDCPDRSQMVTHWVVTKTNDACVDRDAGDAGAPESPDASGSSPSPVTSCMAECPSFKGCVRVDVSPNACSNATCTGPEPECAYAQDPNSDTKCLDGVIMHATGSCIPGK
jgi:hypothetical protein